MLAQAPLSTLLKLDPYVPSEGELLRQMGNGIPLWLAYPWPAYAPPSPRPPKDCMPPPQASSEAGHEAAGITTFVNVLSALERSPATTARVETPTRRMPTERTTGLSIQYDGRIWTSAGMAVPYDESSFIQVGESRGFPIFRRAASKDDRIFVPTTSRMVAPFQPSR